MLSTVRQAWGLITPTRRLRFVQVGLLSIVVSAIEMAAAFAIVVLLGLVLNPGDSPELPLVGDLRGLAPGASYQELVLWTCSIFGVLFLVRAGLFLFQQYAVAKVSENTAVQLSDRLVDGYLSMPYEWHLARNSAILVRNAWDNVLQVKVGVFTPIAQIVAEGTLAVGMLIVLLASSVSLTLVAGLVLGITVSITMALVQPRLKRLGQKRQGAAGSALRELQQGFGGIRDLKILGREEAFSRRYVAQRQTVAVSEYWRAALAYVPRTSIELAFLLLLVIGIGFAVTRGEVESVLATLGVFAYAGLRIQPSLQKISTALNNLRFADAAVQELSDGLALLDSSRMDRRRDDQSTSPLGIQRDLRFEAVTYHYPSSAEPALSGIDLSVARGESLGIVGATGGGKSTLLDLMCGLLTPTSGRILVDGAPIAGQERSWMRSLGVVHQEAFLTDDTLAANIALGVPADKIDEDRLRWCLRVSQLETVIAELPVGLDTVVGEHGSRLSGGQRQRVTVARALYGDPSLLILDEGTASLDNATERRLVDHLSAIPGLTTVMVAHRLSTVARCDQILVLDGGQIVARGTYEELLKASNHFQQLVSGGG